MEAPMGGLNQQLPAAFLDELCAFLSSLPTDIFGETPAIAAKKKELAAKYGLRAVPSDILILTHLSRERLPLAQRFLKTKPIRTGSGVAVVAVMTKPLPCPHGKCTYCPGGPGSAFGDVPQSYTGHEPAAMRGARAGYDAYVQVFTRIEQYIVSGHSPEKVELILMGGTFPSYPEDYQDEVIRDVFAAMNDFSSLFYTGDEGKGKELDFEKFKEFFALPGSIGDDTRTELIKRRILAQKAAQKVEGLAARNAEGADRRREEIPLLQEANETAVIRCVGLTIETRPSHARREHGLRMLMQGCTRVELGVQTTYDDVLAAVHRDHTVKDTIDAARELRDLGFKLNFHIMLGLPGMTPERDLAAIKRLFEDPDFRPDMLKLYPCMVLPGTALFHEYKAGRYTPYTTAQAAALIAEAMTFVPEWCRVMRVQRDIPTHVTAAGVNRTNLRQYVERKIAENALPSREIRGREIGSRPILSSELRVTEYDAAGGREFFIQMVEPRLDALIGFCRLRYPGNVQEPSFHPDVGLPPASVAIIRELHVYGDAVGVNRDGKVQHKGFGRALVEKAEEIARAAGKTQLLVISGVGVRGYYRKLGYVRMGPYMGKRLDHAP